MAAPDAEALWRRFSAWMDAHPSDLSGFARSEGFASVHPELHGREPTLVVSRTAGQRPFESAATKGPRGARGGKGRPSRRR